jgi:hypothetical protein
MYTLPSLFVVLCTHIRQLTLEKTTEVVTNGQSRDTSNIGHKTHDEGKIKPNNTENQ